MTRPNQYRDISYLLSVVLAVVVVATLYLARVVVVPFALAMLFSFLLTPVVIWLERIRFPRGLAVLIVMAVFIAAIGLVGWTVTDQIVNVTSLLPSYKANIENKIDSIRSPNGQGLNKATDAVMELSKELSATPTSEPAGRNPGTPKSSSPAHPLSVQVVPPPTNLFAYAGSVLGPLGTAGIAIVFTIFMLIRREDVRDRFIRIAGRGHLNLMTQALDEASHRVSRYLFLQFVVNACYGVVVATALYFIGVPNAMLWGVGAGILRFLPYIGPPMGAILPILLSLAVFNGWTRALVTIGLFVGIELVASNLIEPSLYGAQTGVSPLAILFAAVFWTLLWGPIGLLLSTPLTVCLVVMARHVPHLGFLHVLMGDEPVLPPEGHFYQRLLAADRNEAKQILDTYLQDKSIEDLYNLVLMPALSLEEQDRHKNELDKETGKFICQSIKEFVEEINDRSNEQRAMDAIVADKTDKKDAGHAAPAPFEAGVADRSSYVLCVPVRDEADEIIGIMLAHLLERVGFRAQFIEVGTSVDMLARVSEEQPDIVCLSALPPFAVDHARRLYGKLRAQSPDLKIVIGLWNSSADRKKAASRIIGIADSNVPATLAHAILQIEVLSEVVPQPGDIPV